MSRTVEPSTLLLRVVAVATTVLLALTEQPIAVAGASAAFVGAWLVLSTSADRST